MGTKLFFFKLISYRVLSDWQCLVWTKGTQFAFFLQIFLTFCKSKTLVRTKQANCGWSESGSLSLPAREPRCGLQSVWMQKNNLSKNGILNKPQPLYATVSIIIKDTQDNIFFLICLKMIRQLHTLCASFCFCAILLKLLSSRCFMPFSVCWTPCERQNYCLFSHDSFWMNTLVHVLKGLQWWNKLFGAAWSSSVWPFKKLFKTWWLSSALPAWAQCVLASQASHRTRTCRSNNRTDSIGKSIQIHKVEPEKMFSWQARTS